MERRDELKVVEPRKARLQITKLEERIAPSSLIDVSNNNVNVQANVLTNKSANFASLH